jgi:probable HAF family extracellular repeat protein
MSTTRISLLVVALSAMCLSQTALTQNARPRYKLVDLGTFGGPHSAVGGQSVVVSNTRKVAGGADAATPDPYAPDCFDRNYCFVEHAFLWQAGVLNDLGTLPGGYSSFGYAINAQGLVVGWSQNGVLDPLTGVPEYVPTAWRNGQIIEIGTFGGAFGQAAAVNDSGFVVGGAENGTPDPFGLADVFGIAGSTELRAFGWSRDRGLFDLGTLGGPGALALSVSSNGQVAGTSFASDVPGPTGLPPLDPFLWSHGVMIDLGTLGGTVGIAAKVTNHGQVVGDSDLNGDSTSHGFSWKRGVLTDLGTLGGNFSTAKWVNEAGEVVGYASNEKELIKAFRWKDGKMQALGTVDTDVCSAAWSINEAGQIVGNSASTCNFAEERAFLWEKGQIFDLNAFVPPASDLYLFEADFINDRGDITGVAVLPSGDVHQYLLLRCGPDDDSEARGGLCMQAEQNSASRVIPAYARVKVNRLDRDYVSRIRSGQRNRP